MNDNEIITDDEILRAWDFSKMIAINIGSVTLGKAEVVAINGLLSRQMYEIEKLTVELQAMRGAANSYKAENKRLEAMLEDKQFRCDACDRIGLTRSEYIVCIRRAKAEAVKEFAERLKEKIICRHYNLTKYNDFIAALNAIDNLVKEFVEGNNDE